MTTALTYLERLSRERYAEIARFASQHAGTALDLDPELEQAGMEAIEAEEGEQR